jgi:aryl-alcohol dehydrogenase-like predicted oxidoreductase
VNTKTPGMAGIERLDHLHEHFLAPAAGSGGRYLALEVRIVCARYGIPIGAAAIQFVLRHPAVTAVVVGARDATEVIEDVSYLTAALPTELLGELAASTDADCG